MPTADRLTAAVGVIDVELAEWAMSSQIKASVGQIRRWRLAGLLPTPSVARSRPSGSPAGRLAKGYTDSDLQIAHRAVAFLAPRARRGRPTTDLALLLFAAGLPVRCEAVVAALRVWTERTRREVGSFMKVAAATQVPIAAGMAVSATFDKAEAAAEHMLSTGNALAGMIRRNLRKSQQRAGEPEEAVRAKRVEKLLQHQRVFFWWWVTENRSKQSNQHQQQLTSLRPLVRR